MTTKFKNTRMGNQYKILSSHLSCKQIDAFDKSILNNNLLSTWMYGSYYNSKLNNALFQYNEKQNKKIEQENAKRNKKKNAKKLAKLEWTSENVMPQTKPTDVQIGNQRISISMINYYSMLQWDSFENSKLIKKHQPQKICIATCTLHTRNSTTNHRLSVFWNNSKYWKKLEYPIIINSEYSESFSQHIASRYKESMIQTLYMYIYVLI